MAYDHYGDGRYFDRFRRLFSSLAEFERDNSLIRELGTEDVEAFLRHLREGPMASSTCTIVLCGAHTHLRKFVDWEIKATLDDRRGLIGVVLPNNPGHDTGHPVLPERLQDNFDGGFAVVLRWEDLSGFKVDLGQRISFAIGRDPLLIDNSRPLRRQNGAG